jgi:acyl-coenzyme A thioesterase PaaI-like protein
MSGSSVTLTTETFEWAGWALGARRETEMSGLAYVTGLRDGTVRRPPVGPLMSAELVDVAPGRVQLICSISDPQFGLYRELDPGMASLLVNTAISCVAQTLLGLGQGWATSASNSDYIRPASPRAGTLVASAEVLESWDERVLVKGQLTDECGQVIMSVTSALDLIDL